MKRHLDTKDFVQYIHETYGCRNIETICYTLTDKETNETLLEGSMKVTQEARLLVMGLHPSGNKYGSVVGAMLDLNDEAIKSFLRQRMDNKALMETGLPQSSAQYDEQARRLKAIVWQVTDVDDEEKTIWVSGVV